MKKFLKIYKALTPVFATQELNKLVIIVIIIDNCNNIIMKLPHISSPSVYPILISTTTIQPILEQCPELSVAYLHLSCFSINKFCWFYFLDFCCISTHFFPFLYIAILLFQATIIYFLSYYNSFLIHFPKLLL